MHQDILVNRTGRGVAVFHNHAGCFYVLHVQGNPFDVWEGTKINPKGGTFRLPQRATSWVLSDFAEGIGNSHAGMKVGLSDRDRSRIATDVQSKTAEMKQLIERDPRLNVSR